MGEIQAGYNARLWGQPPQGKENKNPSPWYGYLRPSITIDSAITYNSIKGQLELHPISFIGIRGGAEGAKNTSNYRGYDCTTLSCKGTFYQYFAAAQIFLGAGPVFGAVEGKVEYLRQKNKALHFIDPVSSLMADLNGDRLLSLRAILGFQVEKFSFMAIGLNQRMKNIKGETSMFAGIISYRWTSLRLSVGAGTFKSDTRGKKVTVLGNLTWTLSPSFSLAQ